MLTVMSAIAQRRTKILATLGPATDSPEMLAALIDGGVNVFRLNMSHAPHDWVRRVVKDIRAAASARRLTPAGFFIWRIRPSSSG